MAHRTKNAVAVKRVSDELNKAGKISYRTITDLPAELLHMIMSEVRREWYAVKPCSLTCRTLRDVAVEYLRYRWVNLEDVAAFLTFVRNHPRIGKTVTNLIVRGPLTDVKVVSDMKQLLPNLHSFDLDQVLCDPQPLREDAGELTSSPLRLSDMTLGQRSGAPSFIPGMMYLLSLLELHHLHLYIADVDYGEELFDAKCLARPSAVESIQVSRWSGQPIKHMARAIDALSKTLSADCLRKMWIAYDSKDTLRAYHTMFERVGRNITTLTVVADAPFYYKNREYWVNPFDDFTLLNIQACKKLESLTLPIYIPQAKPEKAVSLVATGVLVHYAPSTLRHITIMLHDLRRPTTLGNRTVLKLQEFDKVATQARFPHLETFQLCIKATDDLTRKDRYWEKCADAARRALPSLHARGLLKLKDGNYSYMRR